MNKRWLQVLNHCHSYNYFTPFPFMFLKYSPSPPLILKSYEHRRKPNVIISEQHILRAVSQTIIKYDYITVTSQTFSNNDKHQTQLLKCNKNVETNKMAKWPQTYWKSNTEYKHVHKSYVVYLNGITHHP